MGVLNLSAALVQKSSGRVMDFVLYGGKGGKQRARVTYREGEPSMKQKLWHEVYRTADNAWKSMPQWHRDEWRVAAKGKGQSNYAAFMHVNLDRLKEGKPIKWFP